MVHITTGGLRSRIGGTGQNVNFHIEFNQITLSQGMQRVKFETPFATIPTITGSFSSSSNTFSSLKVQPFSVKLLRSQLARLGLSPIKLGMFSAPRALSLNIPKIPDIPAPTDQIVPWGTTWQQAVVDGCGSIPVLGILCDGLGLLLRFVGNAAFLAYYAGSGDFKVIARSILTQAYTDLTGQINSHIINNLNPIIGKIEDGVNTTISDIATNMNASLSDIQGKVNAQITDTETKLNQMISNIEQTMNASINSTISSIAAAVNLAPSIIMQAIGYQPNSNGQYLLPIPANIDHITIDAFDIYVPQDGLTLNYVAFSK